MHGGIDQAVLDVGGCVVGGRHSLPDAVWQAAIRGGPVPGAHSPGPGHAERAHRHLPAQARHQLRSQSFHIPVRTADAPLSHPIASTFADSGGMRYMLP